MKDNVVLVKNNGFKIISLQFVFSVPKSKDEVVLSSLLKRILLDKTLDYPTEELLGDARIENYVLSMNVDKIYKGDNLIFKFSFTIPDAKVLNDPDYSYEKTIRFILSVIYKPLIKDNSFLDDDTSKVKRKLDSYIRRAYENINSYSTVRLNEIIDEEDFLNYDMIEHKDEIDKINGTDLFNFYNKIIGSKNPYVFVFGNVDNSLKKIIENELDEKLELSNLINYNVKPTLLTDLKVVDEQKSYNQSVVSMVYKIADYKKEDKSMLSIIISLLNYQASNILNEFLREKENLVYTSGSFGYSDYGIMGIKALIYRDNKDRTIKTIKDVMEKLKDESYIKEKLENVKRKEKINLERQKDLYGEILRDFIYDYFKWGITSDEYYNFAKNVTAKDVALFAQRLNLSVIYYLEGTKNEG